MVRRIPSLAAYLFFFGLVLALSFVPQAPARAAPETFGPRPDWVSPSWLPGIDPSRANQTVGGVYMLLADRQENWHPGEKDTYYRIAYQVQGREGLEWAASVAETYDPSHETILFHHLKVIRDGVAKDISGTTSFTTIRQERDLQSGLLTGELTLHAELDDIRVGDIVDYAYTINSRALVAHDYYSGTFKAASSEPVGLLRFRLLVPMGTSLYQKADDGITLNRTGQLGKSVVYERLVVNPEPQLAEEAVPGWIDQWPYVQLSSMPSWSALVKELLPAYEAAPSDLPADFLRQVDEIGQRYAEPTARMGAALRLVQDTIRYVGIEIGTGSFLPRRPEEVVSTGYGDCKDKALLLATALRRLGIEAHVALVNSNRGEALAGDLPSPYRFDHAIVEAVVDGKTYWLDATLSQQGGAGSDVIQASYGYALPIAAGTENLLHMPAYDPKEPDAALVELFEVPEKPDAPIALTVTATYGAWEAERMRYRLSASSTASIQRGYDDRYGRSYPGAYRQEEMTVADDRDANRIVITNKFFLDRDDLKFVSPGGRFHIDGDFLDGFLPVPALHGRRFPVALDAPMYRRQTTMIRGPHVRMDALESQTLENAYFTFKLDSRAEDGSFDVDWELKILQPTARVDDMRSYLRDVRSLKDALWWSYGLEALYPMLPQVVKPVETAPEKAAKIDDKPPVTQVSQLNSNTFWLVVALACSGILLCRWLVRALGSDREYCRAGFYYPVSIKKFVIMNIATLGWFQFFWVWKCFLWMRDLNGRKIWVSPRMLFYPLWLYSLFRDANRRIEGRQIWWGMGLAGCGVSVVAQLLAGLLSSWPTAEPTEAGIVAGLISVGLVVVSTLGALPIVLAVHRANPALSEVEQRNSRISKSSALVMIPGLLTYAVLVLMAFRTFHG
ncbi:DUF3857 domain-containing protein [Radicibacter daui]|uniref:DUF3857 domain-containing protein n=1 Tax=Radicibacter daui TaxID=3064829 RepID=UPI0040470189